MEIRPENGVGYIAPLEKLAEQFRHLPGIGKKTAYRLAYHLAEAPEAEAAAFAEAILAVKKLVTHCRVCRNISDSEVCPLCRSSRRNARLICLVEEPRDVAAIEKLGEYDGLYHVLGGVISPLDGRGPEQLAFRELLERTNALLSEDPSAPIEVITATNPTVEGEATAMYAARLLKPLGVRVTRLAKGIPVGGDLEYADEVTLQKAIEGRTEL